MFGALLIKESSDGDDGGGDGDFCGGAGYR